MKKIIKWMFKDIINLKIGIPRFLVILLLIIPFIGYLDFVTFKQTTISGYILVCLIEFLLFFSGYTISQNIKKVK